MKELRLEEVARAVGGTILAGDPSLAVTGVTVDSRSASPGDLFFALPGRRTDGHLFVEDAFSRGARAAVVGRPVAVSGACGLVLVSDTLRALQDLASYYRGLFSLPVVAVTGSTGKTTTKDLTAAVLGVRFRVHKSAGNQNNEIGLPLTLLGLEEHEVLVVEMAMRGRGEIAALCAIARPKIGVITNIGLTHLELLGSQEEIARAKGELLEALPSDGWAILNEEDPWQRRLAGSCRAQVLFYGGAASPVRALSVEPLGLSGTRFVLCTPRGEASCFLPLPGRHNVKNALAAAAVGHVLGLSPEEIARGLAAPEVTGGRVEVKRSPRGFLVIDDSYNASPSSVAAALELLAAAPREGRAVAVLGEMRELGWYTIPGHREVGTLAASLGLDLLCTVGELAEEIALGALSAGMKKEQVRSFATKEEVAMFLNSFLAPGDVVLVKASRAAGLEELVEGLVGGGEGG